MEIGRSVFLAQKYRRVAKWCLTVTKLRKIYQIWNKSTFFWHFKILFSMQSCDTYKADDISFLAIGRQTCVEEPCGKAASRSALTSHEKWSIYSRTQMEQFSGGWKPEMPDSARSECALIPGVYCRAFVFRSSWGFQARCCTDCAVSAGREICRQWFVGKSMPWILAFNAF